MSNVFVHRLPAGHTLSAAVDNGTVGVRQVEDPTVVALASVGSPAAFGPYLLDRTFHVFGFATVTIAESDPVANIPTTAEKTILDGIPTTDPADDGVSIWADTGTLKVSGPSV